MRLEKPKESVPLPLLRFCGRVPCAPLLPRPKESRHLEVVELGLLLLTEMGSLLNENLG